MGSVLGVASQDDPALDTGCFSAALVKTMTCTHSICLCMFSVGLARNGPKQNTSTLIQIVVMNTKCGCNNMFMYDMCFVGLGWEGLR